MRGHKRRLAGLPAAIAVLAGLAFPISAGAVIPSGNLLTNPGAEASTGAANTTAIVPPTGWPTSSNFTALQYAAGGGGPDASVSAQIGGGTNLFAGGPTNDVSTATQFIDVTVAAPEVDAGQAGATLSGFLGGYIDQDDNMVVVAYFYDGAANLLGQVQIGPVTPVDRSSQTTLLPRTAVGNVPPGTRTVAVVMTATRTEGNYNDGYADNLDLTMGPPVAQLGESVSAGPISGRVLVKRPGASGFEELTGLDEVPVGSQFDTTAGRMVLTSETSTGASQSIEYYDGTFEVDQAQSDLVTATLISPKGACKGRRSARGGGGKTKLWGKGKGNHKSKGKGGSGSARGTEWLTQDMCNGKTLFKVKEGSVQVKNFKNGKKTLVKAGDKITVGPKR